MYNITLIGASDGFGKWLAEFLTSNFCGKINLTITGRKIEKLQSLREKLKCNYSINNIEAIKNADVTIFCVPIEHMIKTIKEIAPYLKENSIVADITSIKKGPRKALQKYTPKSVLIIPTHPMFGPYISLISGQIFVLTPDEKVKQDFRYKFLCDFLNQQNASIIESTPEEHDKMMAIVQGLTHFSMFVIGDTIKRLGVDIDKSMDFVSPIYKIMISSVSRYMNQNPKLYGDIQMFNDEILPVHEIFMQVSNDFNTFVKNKDEDSFIETILQTQKYFGKNAEKGQKYTDKIIYLYSKQIEKIKQNIGKEVSFVNIYSKQILNDKIISYEKGKIYLKQNGTIDSDEYEIIP